MKKKKFSTTSKRAKLPAKKIALFALFTLFVALVLFGLDRYGVVNLPFIGKEESQTTSDDINYGPPTKQELEETESFKQNSTKEPDKKQTTDTAQTKSVTPVISSWGQSAGDGNVEISGYVDGVYENGGTCTLTLEKSGKRVSQSQSAALNAQNISCGFISIERSKLDPGEWTATLAYSSNTASGTSQPVKIEVQ